MAQDFPAAQENYIHAEYDKLNKELESILKEIRSREKYSLTIVAAVAVWLFNNYTETDHYLLLAASFIPLITTLIYGSSVLALSTNITWIREYLTRIENHFLEKSSPFGWERFFEQKNEGKFYFKASAIMWSLQLIISGILITAACNSECWKTELKMKKQEKITYLSPVCLKTYQS